MLTANLTIGEINLRRIILYLSVGATCLLQAVAYHLRRLWRDNCRFMVFPACLAAVAGYLRCHLVVMRWWGAIGRCNVAIPRYNPAIPWYEVQSGRSSCIIVSVFQW